MVACPFHFARADGAAALRAGAGEDAWALYEGRGRWSRFGTGGRRGVVKCGGRRLGWSFFAEDRAEEEVQPDCDEDDGPPVFAAAGKEEDQKDQPDPAAFEGTKSFVFAHGADPL